MAPWVYLVVVVVVTLGVGVLAYLAVQAHDRAEQAREDRIVRRVTREVTERGRS